MEAALIALAGALVGHLLTAHYKSAERRAAQFKALATFLDNTAECLEEMKSQLSSYVVPTAAGNRLKTHIRDYEENVKNAEVAKKVRLALSAVLVQVRQCLLEGQAEDEILRGAALRYDDKSRNALLSELERTAARLKGEADSLRARAA